MIKARKIANARKRVWMFRSKSAFKARKRPFAERLSLRKPALGLVKLRQVANACKRGWMILSTFPFLAGNGTFVERFRFVVAPLRPINLGEVVQEYQSIGMVGS